MGAANANPCKRFILREMAAKRVCSQMMRRHGLRVSSVSVKLQPRWRREIRVVQEGRKRQIL